MVYGFQVKDQIKKHKISIKKKKIILSDSSAYFVVSNFEIENEIDFRRVFHIIEISSKSLENEYN